ISPFGPSLRELYASLPLTVTSFLPKAPKCAFTVFASSTSHVLSTLISPCAPPCYPFSSRSFTGARRTDASGVSGAPACRAGDEVRSLDGRLPPRRADIRRWRGAEPRLARPAPRPGRDASGRG